MKYYGCALQLFSIFGHLMIGTWHDLLDCLYIYTRSIIHARVHNFMDIKGKTEIKQLIDVDSFSRSPQCLNSSFERSCEDPY